MRTLQADLAEAHAEHTRYSLLAEVQRLRDGFEAAMAREELGAAATYLLELRERLPRVHADASLSGTALVSLLRFSPYSRLSVSR